MDVMVTPKVRHRNFIETTTCSRWARRAAPHADAVRETVHNVRRLLLMLPVLAGLAGCSGGDDGTAAATVTEAPVSASTAATAAPAAGPDAALELAVRTYSAAFLAGDGESAFNLLSARCRARTDQGEFTAAVSGASSTYGKAKITGYEQEQLAGQLARVSYTYDQSAIDQKSEPWVQEDGDWKQDDC